MQMIQLEIMLDKHVSFPVGRAEYIAIHPCSFIEYLTAIGEGRFVEYQPRYGHSNMVGNP